MTPVDGVYGVIDSGVQDRKAARGMHGCRLGTGSANNHEKRSVPLDNRIDRVGRGLLRILWLIMERSGITTGDLCRKTRAEKHQRSEEHTSELQSRLHLVCRLLLEKKKEYNAITREYSNDRPTRLT